MTVRVTEVIAACPARAAYPFRPYGIRDGALIIDRANQLAHKACARTRDRVTITVDGSPVAELIPPVASRRTSISRQELVAVLERQQTDPALRSDLDGLTG